MEIGGIVVDGQLIFAIVFALVAIGVAAVAIGFALWYAGDQEEL